MPPPGKWSHRYATPAQTRRKDDVQGRVLVSATRVSRGGPFANSTKPAWYFERARVKRKWNDGHTELDSRNARIERPAMSINSHPAQVVNPMSESTVADTLSAGAERSPIAANQVRTTIAHLLPWPAIGGTEIATVRLIAATRKEFRHVAFCIPGS